MIQSMMSFTDLLIFLWGHALLSAIHLLNRVSSKSVSTTLYELWQAGKLEARSFRACFIGYPKKIMGYYLYFFEDHNVIVSYHAVFLKKEFIQDGGSGRKIELEEKFSEEHRVQELEPNNEPVDVIPLPPHRSSRSFHPLKGIWYSYRGFRGSIPCGR